MNTLYHFESPQLNKIHAGKVRDSIAIDDKKRLIVVTDRISAFNKNLLNAIPQKGGVLNSLTNFWFKKTEHIIENHFIEQIDDNISMVKECEPIKVEMIVRAYLTGSMWRGYQEQGQREFCGISVEDGLTYNQKFSNPILTPTTKDADDTEITEVEIIKRGLVDEKTYQEMKKTALALFDFGSKYMLERGIILVDTKYEFGFYQGKLILIDEIHTPDSSRFWNKADYEANPVKAEQIDKEFVRQWMLQHKIDGKIPLLLEEQVVAETSKRYRDIYQIITGEAYQISNLDIKTRMYHNLVAKKLIQPAFIGLIMGSKSDVPHAENIIKHLAKYNVKTQMRVISAHKNGERIVDLANQYNNSIEPVCVIAIAGRSNGLGGALAANLSVLVINCPPFKDNDDIMVNVNSSLLMPSFTPAVTIVYPDNAALAAIRSFNIPEYKDIINAEIDKMKHDLITDDEIIKNL
jgi:fusion protein PurCD